MKEKITKQTNKAKEYFLEHISFTITPFELKEMIKNNINEINSVINLIVEEVTPSVANTKKGEEFFKEKYGFGI